MKTITKVLSTVLVLLVAACSQPVEKTNETKTDLSGVVESKIIDDAIAYQKAGGKAEFMGG